MANLFRVYFPNNCGHSYIGFSRRKNLKQHLQFECGVEPQFQCSFYLKQFSQKATLKRHFLRIHNTIF